MKNVQFACLILLFAVSTTWAGGTTTINPGSERTLTQDPAAGGAASDNGNITYILQSTFNVDTKTIRAGSSALASGIGTGSAAANVFYEFEVGSTPETDGNTVGAWISYVVDWSGHQAVLAVGASNSAVDIELVLRDMTTPSNLHVESVHSLDLKTHKVKFVLFGIDLDDSSLKASTFPAVLKRGHTYRLTLRMSVNVFLLAVPGGPALAESVYLDPGVRLLSLNAKVGLDEKEVLQRLESFENHRHIYLTGRGEGHNNTQATSSLPVIAKPASPKLFLIEEDTPIIKPEAVPTGKPIFEKP